MGLKRDFSLAFLVLTFLLILFSGDYLLDMKFHHKVMLTCFKKGEVVSARYWYKPFLPLIDNEKIDECEVKIIRRVK